ncbi:MAG: hypothetical protein QXN69_02255, partial [Candidatus Methanomethylicaceae archaeon]
MHRPSGGEYDELSRLIDLREEVGVVLRPEAPSYARRPEPVRGAGMFLLLAPGLLLRSPLTIHPRCFSKYPSLIIPHHQSPPRAPGRTSSPL